MLSRRSFFGGLLGLLGLGGVVKVEEKIEISLSPRSGKWSWDWVEVIKRELEKHGVSHLENPNRSEDWESLIGNGGDQLEQTGMALFWKVPDSFGKAKEVYLIPTQYACPHSASKDYPDGYYVVRPHYYCPSYVEAVGNFAIIPSQWMLRVRK